MTTIHKDIYAGNKSLSVDINTERNTATVRFGSRIPRWLYRKQPGETTTVFRLADQLLADTARSLHKSLILRFDTANRHLKHWILAHEAEFDFDAVEPRDIRAYRMTVRKTYTVG